MTRVPLPSPDHLRARATALRRMAASIEACDVLGLRLRAGDDVWIGPTAATCLDDVTTRAAHLRYAVDDMRSTAHALDAHAAVLDSAAQRAPT